MVVHIGQCSCLRDSASNRSSATRCIAFGWHASQYTAWPQTNFASPLSAVAQSLQRVQSIRTAPLIQRRSFLVSSGRLAGMASTETRSAERDSVRTGVEGGPPGSWISGFCCLVLIMCTQVLAGVGRLTCTCSDQVKRIFSEPPRTRTIQVKRSGCLHDGSTPGEPVCPDDSD